MIKMSIQNKPIFTSDYFPINVFLQFMQKPYFTRKRTETHTFVNKLSISIPYVFYFSFDSDLMDSFLKPFSYTLLHAFVSTYENYDEASCAVAM